MRHHLSYLITVGMLFACGKEEGETKIEYIEKYIDSPVPILAEGSACKDTLKSECEGVMSKLTAAQQKLDKAIEQTDRDTITMTQMEINELNEILRSYSNGKTDISEIERRYKALRNILASESHSEILPNITYVKPELEVVRQVFEEFGDLYIEPTPLAENGRPKTVPMMSVADEDRPWSGYWYPKYRPEMFETDDSPLGKFDQYLSKMGINSSIAEWERARWRPGIYAAWEGLCDALAIAAVLTKEPRRSVTINDVTFTAADQKALAVKYFEGYWPPIYGLRYDGTAKTDGEMQDIRPEAFHRIAEVIIGERKQALLIDSDPGPEVWAKPIYRITWSIAKDPDIENAYLVNAFPTIIEQRGSVPQSDEESWTNYFIDSSSPKLEYRLYVDPNDRKGKKMKVIAGEWINSSADNHPDFVMIPDTNINSSMFNKELAKYSHELRDLLTQLGLFPSEPVD